MLLHVHLLCFTLMIITEFSLSHFRTCEICFPGLFLNGGLPTLPRQLKVVGKNLFPFILPTVKYCELVINNNVSAMTAVD